MRNFEMLTKRQVKFFQRCLLKLRKQKIFRTVKGGCCSIEFTHEGRGWHMHAHLLLDVRFLDVKKVVHHLGETPWTKICDSEVDGRQGQDYVKEVSKYVVERERNRKVGWQPNQPIHNRNSASEIFHRFRLSPGDGATNKRATSFSG